MPSNACRCTVSGPSPMILEGTSRVQLIPPNSDTCQKTMQKESPEMWENVTIELEGRDVWNSVFTSLSLGTITAVSDGSFDPKKQVGSFAIILSATSEQWTVSISNLPPGHWSVKSAYRSELAGIFMIIHLLCCIINGHNLSQGRVKLKCDGEASFTSIFTHKASVKYKHYDIIGAAQKWMKNTPILKITWGHVYGHQGKKIKLMTYGQE